MAMIENRILHFDKYIENTQNKVLSEYMRKAQIELIKEVHPYAITPPKKDGGRWQTHIKDATQKSGRRQIRAQTEDELFKKLADIYLAGDKFAEVYSCWIEYLLSYGKAGETVQRHEQRYAKYLANSKIPNMSVRNINLLALEKECNRIVSSFNLSHHEWTQLKTILIGTFKYAVKKGMISENPMSKIEIGVRFKQTNKKPSETQVFQTTEYNELIDYLEAMYTETEDDSFLAIMFGLYTGVRVGELAALRFEDIHDKTIHVIREEVQRKTKVDGKWTSSCIVVPHTKTNTDRFVSLLPQALKVIERLRQHHDNCDGFLFTRNGERLRERQLCYVLEKFAERKNKPTKSSHKMRKTYASRLNASGVPLEHIRVELGHRYLTSTMGYIYNPLTDEETYNLMAQAF